MKNGVPLGLKFLLNFFSPGVKPLLKHLLIPALQTNLSRKQPHRYSYAMPRLLPFFVSKGGVKLVSKETAINAPRPGGRSHIERAMALAGPLASW